MARYPLLREELPIFVGYGQLNQGLSMCRKTLAKLIFVGYGQLNSTRFFAPGTYATGYLNMQHLGALHNFFRSDSSFCESPTILYPRSIYTDILE